MSRVLRPGPVKCLTARVRDPLPSSPAIRREEARAEQKISRIYGNLVSAMIVLHTVRPVTGWERGLGINKGERRR